MKYDGRPWIAALLAFGACSERAPAHPDAAPDAAVDAAIGAPVDAAIDAPADAAIDAPPAPHCLSTPEILVDTFPRRLSNMAVVDGTLYYAAYTTNTSGQATDTTIESLDLATRTEGASVTTTGVGFVTAAEGYVYAAAGTQVWRFHPGDAPNLLVTDPFPMWLATAAGEYVYWTNNHTIFRRLIAGGETETVTSCEDPRRLTVSGGNVYCASFDGYIHYAPVTGGAEQEILNPPGVSYPIITMQQEGDSLFYVTFNPDPCVYRAELPAGSTSVEYEHGQVTRFDGLAVTQDYFYVTGYNLLRINRASHAVETVYSTNTSTVDPVIWNDELFFVASDQQTSGYRYIMHCAE